MELQLTNKFWYKQASLRENFELGYKMKWDRKAENGKGAGDSCTSPS